MQTTREKLVDVAARLVDEGGAQAVTLREVGARAGVSHNAPYKHFDDKRDLLAAVAAAELNTLAGRIDAAAQREPSALERVRVAALTHVRWARTHPARFELVFGSWGTAPHAELGRAAEAATNALYDNVTTAVTDGALHGDPHAIAAMIWSLGHGAVDLELAGHLTKKPNSPTPEHLVDRLLTLLSRPTPDLDT